MATLTQYSEFETLLDEIAPGETISREQACRLIRCPAELLPDLLRAARAERARHKPAVITYSRKVFLPLTNLCADYCGYCAFRRDPREEGAHTMTPDEILALVAQAERLGCTEALFSLGDKPEARFPEMKDILRRLGYKSTLHYLEAMCELVLRHSRLLPHANPGLMSASWINRLAAVSPSLGLMLETTSRGLLEAGGAHEHAPDKIPVRRLQVLNEAGKQQVPFTTGILIGIGETLDDRVDALFAIRDMHQQYGHIQEVIVQNFRAKTSIPMRDWPEPSEDDLLRTVAVARLILGGKMNVQAPPNLFAPNFSRLLDAGINDWGGISPLTPDFINPERPWPHLRAGFTLKQRLPVYPEFIPSALVRGGAMGERLRQAADPGGLARSAA